MTRPHLFPLLVLWTATSAVQAAQPQELLAEFARQAELQSPGYSGFDARRGADFFTARHGDWSCSTCHTENPAKAGKHAVTDKLIEPLAPAANAARFADPRKVAKWFKRNCNDVLKRECSALEKGDVLTYLLSVKS
jgi:hypothetical protein